MKTIKIRVPRTGIAAGTRKIEVEADGYVGAACQTATEAIQNALGQTAGVETKPEMYQTEEGVERISE